MYIAVVLATMLLLPSFSIVLEMSHSTLPLGAIVAKWLVFWAVGVRLSLAGLRQMTRPEFTAHDIFGLTDPGATKLVREIGFANVAIGTVAMASLVWPQWLVPAGTIGMIYLGLAGLMHLRTARQTSNETVAMVSDLAGAFAIGLSLAAVCSS